MGKPSAPTPPDPKETSAASTGTSVATAIANSNLRNVNQVGADGSTLTYEQTGSSNFTDPYTGQTYETPQYTATQKLSDPAQQIYDTNQAAQGNLANIARDQSGFLQGYLNKPFQANTSDIEKRLFELGSNTLDPKFERQRSDLQTRLSNQGIKLGSAAYDRALNEQGNTQNQAYTDLALRGRGQAFSELQAQRNQPINEISALLSGSQVSMPNYSTNVPSAIPTTDNAGLINANYNQQMNNYNQQMGQWNSTLGGLLGAGAQIYAASDRRVKKDIRTVGKTNDGQKVYSYRYKSGGPIQLGLMAQDVEKRNPNAVANIGGIKMVNYGEALKNA